MKRKITNGMATKIGLGLTGYQMLKSFQYYRALGEPVGHAATKTLTGIDPGRSLFQQDLNLVGQRLLNNYGPLGSGILVHKGAVAFGVNKMLPKGWTL